MSETADEADEPPTLLVSDADGVRHLRFNRPQRLNALTPALHVTVIDALAVAETDPTVRVVAFSGEGRAFCAGDDISGAGAQWPERYADRRVELDVGVGPVILQDVTSRIRAFPKPTVALMHGYAIGAGLDYALACDVRVCDAGCRFGDTRVHRALWAAEGWTYMLPRLTGAGRALSVGLLGELFDADEGHAMGLLHEIVPAGTPVLEGSAGTLARLSRLSGAAFADTKAALLDGLDLPARAAGL